MAKDASYKVCVPDFELENIETFARNTWGAYWDSTGDGKMVIPFSKWDGALKRGNVFDAGRLAEAHLSVVSLITTVAACCITGWALAEFVRRSTTTSSASLVIAAFCRFGFA